MEYISFSWLLIGFVVVVVVIVLSLIVVVKTIQKD